MFDRGQAASVRRASSLIITSTSSQIKCSEMMMMMLMMMIIIIAPTSSRNYHSVMMMSMLATEHLNVALDVLEEASSDIACFLYGPCHRKAISATVKLLLWLQPPHLLCQLIVAPQQASS